MFGMHQEGRHGGFAKRHQRAGFGPEDRGHRRERMFGQGDIRLLVLDLLAERPRYGYEVIKAIEELAGGDYSPSPGVIYPTLTLLEELGHATATDSGNGKKHYETTAEGKACVEANRDALDRIRGRLAAAGTAAQARRSPEIQRAIQNFRMALHLRLERGELGSEVSRRIADAIDRAAVEIERS